MKKLVIIILIAVGHYHIFAQVDREIVILEGGTGVTCPYCPGSAMGLEDLYANGDPVAAIEYHNYGTSQFNSPQSAARCSYYAITGYPTVQFDGEWNEVVGGSSSQSLYGSYLPYVESRMEIQTSFTVELNGSYVDDEYNIVVTVEKVGSYSPSDLTVQLVLTESEIPYNWFGMATVNFAQRIMVPDAYGTEITLENIGDDVDVELSFTFDNSWDINHCELIAFVQEENNKEVLHGAAVMLTDLGPSGPGFTAGFYADQTDFCEPPSLAQFNSDVIGGTPITWNWWFEGGITSQGTEYSNEENPQVTYLEEGSYDVQLVVYSNEGEWDTAYYEMYIGVHGLPDVFWEDVPILCNEDFTPYELTEGQPDGGVYSGDHIIDGMYFDAGGLEAGEYLVSYTYMDENGCENYADYMITVVACDVHFQTAWTGNPYQPMSIIVNSASVNGSSLQAGDEIGIFDVDDSGNEICVGTAVLESPITSNNPLIIVASADDPTTDEADGFTSGNTILYKLWDTDEQIEISNVNATYDPNFDEIFTSFGTALLSLSAITSVTQTIDLSSGWNSISFYVIPENLNMIDILQPLIADESLIKVIDEAGGTIQYIPGVGWMNTIGDMANTEGYYIKVTETTQIPSTGIPVDLPFTISLSAGWNSIGYPSEIGQDAMLALQPLIDTDNLIKVISEDGGFIEFIPGIGWMNTIGDFEPGEGYYIKVIENDNITFDIPVMPLMKSTMIVGSLPTEYFIPVFDGNPFMPMSIIVVDIHGIEVEQGDELAVFDGETCVGASVIMDNTSVISIVASADDPTTEQKDGFTTGNSLSFKLYKKSESTEYLIADAVYFSGAELFEPLETWIGELMMDITSIGESSRPGSNFLDQSYPNPAQTQTTIKYGLSENGQVKLDFYSMNGTLINTLVDETQQAGTYSVNLNVQPLNPGMYIYKIQVVSNGNNWVDTRIIVVK